MNTDDYMDDLGKWQAYSDPVLAKTKPEDLFQPDCVETYRRLHADLWERITRVHGSLLSLDRIAEFPFDFMYGPNDMEFWRLVAENFQDVIIVMLHGLVNDGSGSDAHTLRTFKNQIRRCCWLQPENGARLKRTWKGRDFDKDVKMIAARVGLIRTNIIAHRLVDKQTGKPKEIIPRVTLAELWSVFRAAHGMFGALSFGAAYVTLGGDMMPATIGGEPTRTSIDQVLDAVVRDNSAVNMPEREPEMWSRRRKHLPPGYLVALNELRRRIHLPEA